MIPHPPSPHKSLPPVTQEKFIKNKDLPSFLYNSGKQSSALYAGTVHLDGNALQNPALLNSEVNSRKWLYQELFEDTDANGH